MSDYRETCPCDFCADWRSQQPKAAEAPKEVPTSRVLTREMVLRGRPCGEFRKRFIGRFPESIDVTVELAVSQASDWDWWWAVSNLLSDKRYQEARKQFNELSNKHDLELAPYRELSNKAYDEYYAARRAASDEAYAQNLPYWERVQYVNSKCEDLRTVPEAAYNAAIAVSDKRLHEGQAKIWAELFLVDAEAYAEEHKNDEPFEDTWDEDIEDYRSEYSDDYDY